MLVSCLTPTRDRRPYIPLAIRAFQTQTHPDRELIILDDGDDPIRDLIPTDTRIIYTRAPLPPQTLGAKLNHLAAIANAQVLCNWDDDDWSSPQRLATQLHTLITSKKALTGFSNFFYWDTTANQAYLWQARGAFSCGPGTAQMYLRSWALAHPFRDITLPVDKYFAEHAVHNNQATAQPGKQLLVARFHGHNSWNTPPAQRGYTKVHPSALPQKFFSDLEAT